MANYKIKEIWINGVRVHATQMREVLAAVATAIKEKRQMWIVTPNPEIVLRAGEDTDFKKILNRADLAIPDGIGLLAAAQMQEWKAKREGGIWVLHSIVDILKAIYGIVFDRSMFSALPEQISGDELVKLICEQASGEGWRVFLLGGMNDTAKRASGELQRRFPGIEVGWHAGTRDIASEDLQEKAAVVQAINNFNAEVLFVAYGAPWQETWLYENKDRLNAKVLMGVGGTLDVLAGNLPEAPRWMREHGLRWMWRLLTDPKRLPRIWRAVVVFGWKMIC